MNKLLEWLCEPQVINLPRWHRYALGFVVLAWTVQVVVGGLS